MFSSHVMFLLNTFWFKWHTTAPGLDTQLRRNEPSKDLVSRWAPEQARERARVSRKEAEYPRKSQSESEWAKNTKHLNMVVFVAKIFYTRCEPKKEKKKLRSKQTLHFSSPVLLQPFPRSQWHGSCVFLRTAWRCISLTGIVEIVICFNVSGHTRNFISFLPSPEHEPNSMFSRWWWEC